MNTWTVTEKESGTKLLAFIKDKLGDAHSARHLKRAIESNLCKVNGRVERFASHIVGKGDKIILHLELETDKPKDTGTSHILYEDDDILIYNKAAGIVSDGKELAKMGYELCHRLDKETTGALIFAKSVPVRELIFQLFREHEIKKTYLAIVDGVPPKKKGVINNYLGKLHAYEGQALWGAVSPDKGLSAHTEWQVEAKGKEASLVRCYPKTGRTHQIRVHMNGMGHPILGDFQYCRKFKCTYKPGRILLHAAEVEFVHPVSGQVVRVEAPLPKDFKEAMEALRLVKY